MIPKSPPPRSLLLRNQVWVVIPAVNWVLGGNSCYYAVGGRGFRCSNEAVIIARGRTEFAQDGLCLEHMGSHMWIGEDGVLYQWRADPPYTRNKIPKIYERVRHGKN